MSNLRAILILLIAEGGILNSSIDYYKYKYYVQCVMKIIAVLKNNIFV